mgnify:CR=1 FL=1
MFRIIKALIGVIFLLFGNLIFSEADKATLFSRLKFHDLTNNTLVFRIPFEFAIPEGYVVTSDTTDKNINLVLHKSDLVRVNQNGGIVEPKIFEFPFYAVQASRRFAFLENEKFSVEKGAQDFDSDHELKYDMKRIDQSKMPVLTMESREPDGQKVRLLLISPNYGTWVFDLQFFDSPRHAEFSTLFWHKIIMILKGQDASAPNISAPRSLIEPQFPDSASYPNDVYDLNTYLWKPMPVPKKLPEIGRTTEAELNILAAEQSITNRLTFLKPIVWPEGKKQFSFDKVITYYIERDYRQDEGSNPPRYSIVGHWEYEVFLLRGKVIAFNLLHFGDDPKNFYTPDKRTLKHMIHKFEIRDLKARYLEQRSELFKKAHSKK